MKTTLFFLMIALTFNFASASEQTRRIVASATNHQAQPEHKRVEIKNVDLAEITGQFNQHHELDVYVWVDMDLGGRAQTLEVIDRNQPGTRSMIALNAGYDASKRRYVYRVIMPARRHFRMDLYAKLELSGSYHYSNQGQPNSFFEFAQ